MAPSKVTVSVAVHKGEPLDFQKKRHTLLWFQFVDPYAEPTAIHIVGPVQAFEVQVRQGYDPATSRTFAGKYDIGEFSKPISKADLVSFVCQTEIDNETTEFNCQTWVGRVLERLRESNFLTQEQCAAGVDRMIDITLGAEDD